VSAVGVDAELNRHTQETSDNTNEDSLGFWREREAAYWLLAPPAQDYVSAPALQAYLLNAFFFYVWGFVSSEAKQSYCGIRESGVRNSEPQTNVLQLSDSDILQYVSKTL